MLLAFKFIMKEVCLAKRQANLNYFLKVIVIRRGLKVLQYLILASPTVDEPFIVEHTDDLESCFKTFIWKLQDKCFNFSTWHNVNANALNSFIVQRWYNR